MNLASNEILEKIIEDDYHRSSGRGLDIV